MSCYADINFRRVGWQRPRLPIWCIAVPKLSGAAGLAAATAAAALLIPAAASLAQTVDAPDFGLTVRVDPVYWADYDGAVRIG